MSSPGTQTPFRSVSLALVASALLCGFSTPVAAQDAGAPPWGEFLRRFNKDPLLKKPYHMDPEEGVKGLASKIRARELDIPNRRRAVRYLADLDCTQFPEAREMLLGLLDPEAEKWEEVRFEAARGLRDMLARHSCNPAAAGNGRGQKNGNGNGSAAAGQCNSCNSCGQQPGLWQQCCNTAAKYSRKVRGERAEPQEAPCHCRSCCDADTLNKLAKTAYELKENGCCYEPSRRVREMAVEAIKACGVPCNYGPYYAEEGEPGPPPMDESGGVPNNGGGEVTPPPSLETTPPGSPDSSAQGVRFPANPSFTAVPTPISRLSGVCIVSLRQGKQVAAREEFRATYRGRVYYFSGLDAQRQFLASPETYAVAFGGCDPVHFVDTQEAVEGRYLTSHDGRFFMFTSKENHERFMNNPARYSGESARTQTVAFTK